MITLKVSVLFYGGIWGITEGVDAVGNIGYNKEEADCKDKEKGIYVMGCKWERKDRQTKSLVTT